jgi:hypothetical protein
MLDHAANTATLQIHHCSITSPTLLMLDATDTNTLQSLALDARMLNA